MVLAQMRLSQCRYREVILADQHVRALDPDSVPPEIDMLDALAESSVGSRREALRLASRAVLNARRASNELLLARADAANARILLIAGSPDQAKSLADLAQAKFMKGGQPVLSDIGNVKGRPIKWQGSSLS